MRLYKLTVKREFVRESEAVVLTSAEAVFTMLAPIVEPLDREQFFAVFLDGRNRVTGFEVISTGSLGASIVHPREAFKLALLHNAAAVIFAHNHPSGDPSPSPEDVRITDRLRRAGETLGIPVLDHVVIGEGRWHSFADNGWS